MLDLLAAIQYIFSWIIEPGDLNAKSRFLFTDPDGIVVDQTGQGLPKLIRLHLCKSRHVEPTLVDHALHGGTILFVEARRFSDRHFVAWDDLGPDTMRLGWILGHNVGMNGNTVPNREFETVPVDESEPIAFGIVNHDLIRWAAKKH